MTPLHATAAATATGVPGVQFVGVPGDSHQRVLTPAALLFLADLERCFGSRRLELLEARRSVQARLDAGWKPDFLTATAAVRAGDWRVLPVPADLRDRRVEITGPTDKKMICNALNSGANVFMADGEDSLSPTWHNVVEGQQNLMDAVRRTLRFEDAGTGKVYELQQKTATLVFRPRGWHLPEKHLLVDGKPMSGSLFDFGLYVFHNARELLARGSGPYFYLPKMESHLEARLWNDVFAHSQQVLGIPAGSIKATVLIETILAAFEMDEILYELREHCAGLNCGRWDYIFSFIKKFRNDPACVLPDRASIAMDRHFLRSYSLLLIQTCHRRGAWAMGGMAAQIPIKDDAARNQAAMDKVQQDKRREAGDGHDGTWVAHPGLVTLARTEFDRVLSGRNHQLDVLRSDVVVTAADLLTVPAGACTEAGLRQNLRVGVQYLEAWLRGSGCVPLYHLMEDAATAEISRTQVWQWVRHGARLTDGRQVDAPLVQATLREELLTLERAMPERFASGRFAQAEELFRRLCTAAELPDFLTLPAYEHL